LVVLEQKGIQLPAIKHS